MCAVINFEALPVSALQKVLPATRPTLYEDCGWAFLGERYSFQVAYRSIKCKRQVTCKITGKIAPYVQMRVVEYVACTYPYLDESSDDYLLCEKPAVVPDILRPLQKCDLYSRHNLWESVYFTVEGAPAGTHAITLTFFDKEEELASVTYTLTVYPQTLPQGDYIYTNWVHYDAIANTCGLPIFTKEYYAVLADYIQKAVAHGMTMLFTPIITPALDTEIGAERLTAQLVDICYDGTTYTFDFTRLGEFMSLAKAWGIRYFEFAHLYTQWGAKCAPKIMATVNGEYKRIFGWETGALSPAYTAFLQSFLPALRAWLIQNDYYSNSFFHISDEPWDDRINEYNACKQVVKGCMPDCTIIDALSHYEFYEQGVVDMPFVSLDGAQKFIDHNAKNYAVYYCTGQKFDYLSNRFMSMPAERTRIIGMQMYQNGVKGLLHWGYNFYFTYLSKRQLDPYRETDGGGAFQCGDAYIVYPTQTGALDSFRHELMAQAFNDYRALMLLEQKIGREAVQEFLLQNGLQKNFTTYPKSAVWLSNLRQKINQKIIEN